MAGLCNPEAYSDFSVFKELLKRKNEEMEEGENRQWRQHLADKT